MSVDDVDLLATASRPLKILKVTRNVFPTSTQNLL
jgi:hypothetical protein